MQAAKGAILAASVALIALAGCAGDKDPTLMNVASSTSGPDEFAIIPPKALQMPEDLAALPEPTPGGSSRTDVTPHEDAIVALGGRVPTTVGVPASEGALVAAAARKGTASGIRQTLATEDLQYRRDNDGRLLERLFNVNVYFKAYRPYALDQQAELARWRDRGVATPSAPPPQPGE